MGIPMCHNSTTTSIGRYCTACILGSRINRALLAIDAISVFVLTVALLPLLMFVQCITYTDHCIT